MIQFLESVDTCCRMYHARHHIEQLQNGPLDHTYQLQERSHHAEGDRAVAQADASPHECQQIAQSEHTTHDQPRGDGKTQPSDDIPTQPLLHRVEPFGHPLLRA